MKAKPKTTARPAAQPRRRPASPRPPRAPAGAAGAAGAATVPPTASEVLYRTLFDSSPVPIFLEDAEGNILDLNLAACAAFGYERRELLGQNVRVLVPPAYLPRVEQNLAALIEGKVLVHEVWSVRKDGALCSLELHEQRITLPDGRPGILALAHDITARRTAEEALRLRDSALQAAANAIVVTDRAGIIVWANPAFSRSTGYTLKEVLGKSPSLVKSGMHDPGFYKQLWDTILAGRVWQGELINRRRDGTHFTESVTITPVRDAAGKLTHFIAVKQDVSERNRMVEQLRVSEQFVRAALDALTAHIAIVDEHGVIIDVNQAWRDFARAHQVPESEVCEGAHYLAVCRKAIGAGHPVNQELAAGLRNVTEGRVMAFACSFPCGWGGTQRWFVARVTRFGGRGPVRLVVAHEEITERKQAEQALTRSGHHFRVLTENMKDVVWVLDADRLRFRYVSPSVELLRGYTADEVMAEPAPAAFAPPEAADQFIAMLRGRAEAFREGQLTPGEFFVNEVAQPRKDGTTVMTEVVTSFHNNPESGHVEVRGVSRDITEREQSRRALQQAKEEFQALFLASPLPIVVIDSAATVRLWSPAAAEMFGWQAAEVIGQPTPTVPPEQWPEMKQFLGRVIEGETIRGGEPRMRRRKDGSLVQVLISAAPLHEPDGTVSGAVVTYTDLTEKARLEAQLLRAQRLESIGHLAGGIAHDLNNVLTPVLMAAPELRPHLSDAVSLRLLDILEASAHRGAEIVKQVLAFARGAELDRLPLQTRHLLRETAEVVRRTFPAHIKLVTSLPRDLWLVKGNSTQLHQVLMNLCLNARDAMPNGGTLTLAAENLQVPAALAHSIAHGSPGPHVVWTVSDTGHGIAPEDLVHIFDPFFTTKPIGKGTGLGLSSVYGSVRCHDGFLQVQSELGKGTEFKIYLPAATESLAQPEPPASVDPGEGRGELILVVDDEASVRELLALLLERHGYRVAVAADGFEGLTRAHELRGQLALVLTDLMMPHMNGAQLIRELRQSQPGLRAVAMSGLASDGMLDELDRLGVGHLLRKPPETSLLLKTLREALDAPVGPLPVA